MLVDAFKNQVQSYIAQHCLIEGDAPVLVTLSGGADSVALLRVLLSMGCNCMAAHCNFHLRGDESNRDEQFVTELCNSLGVNLVVKHMDVPACQRERKLSVEMACRELRYEWFACLADEHKCQAIAVAHHADDNVETFFLNALRSSGLSGLAAMKPRNGNIIRPLLCVTRADVEAYLAELRQPYVVDSTNLENDYKRNRVRNVIVPAIEQEFSGARKTLAITVEHTRDYADLYQDLIDDLKRRVMSVENDVYRIDMDGLLQLKTAKLALLLFDLVKEFGYGFEQCSDIADLIQNNTASGQHFHCSSYTLSISGKNIIIEKSKEIEDDEILLDFSAPDKAKEILEVERSVGVQFNPSMCNGKDVIALSTEVLDCRKVVLRHWRDGDRMKPWGLRGSKLLSDLFTDAKLGPEAKKNVWILEADGVVLWALGLRASSAYSVKPGSADYMLLRRVKE